MGNQGIAYRFGGLVYYGVFLSQVFSISDAIN